jgi:hypothetical protein
VPGPCRAQPPPKAARRRSSRFLATTVRDLLVALAAGCALGAAAWFQDRLLYPWSALVPANMAGVWVLVAFCVGAGARSLPRGAARGLVTLALATLAYYALIRLTGSRPANSAIELATRVWGSVALLAGPLAGLSGAVWRHRTGPLRALAVALVATVLVVDGLLNSWQAGARLFVDPSSGVESLAGIDPVVGVSLLEVLVGFALPFVLLSVTRERFIAFASIGALGIAAIPVAAVALDLLRRIASR